MNGSTHSFEITLNILDIPTTRVSRITRWFIYHVFHQALFVEDTLTNDLEADDFGTLFEDVDGSGRHGSGKDTAYIGMVSSRCGEEYDFFGVGVEDGGNEGDVG